MKKTDNKAFRDGLRRLLAAALCLCLLLTPGLIPAAAAEDVEDIVGEAIAITAEELEIWSSFHEGFEDAPVYFRVPGMERSMTMSRSGDTYYAYSSCFNFCIMDGRPGGHTKSTTAAEKWVKSFTVYDDNAKHRFIVDDSHMLSFSGEDWSSGTAAEAFLLARAYYDVAAWYAATFDWVGLCNDGSENAIIIDDDPDHPATNVLYITIYADPSVARSKDVFAHEFFHSVFRVKTGTWGELKNQTAALSEGLSDVFAALFQEQVLGVDDWVIGRNIPSTKYLPRAEQVRDGKLVTCPRTMDDYLTESHPWWELQEHIIDAVNGKRSTKYSHENSAIISHTLYNIWDNVFGRDSERFEKILFRSVDYIPANGEFSHFRDAFLSTMDIYYPSDIVAEAARYFNLAGIKPPDDDYRKEIRDRIAVEEALVEEGLAEKASENGVFADEAPVEDGFPSCLYDFTKLTYGQIRQLDWAGGLFTDRVGGNGSGSWVFSAEYADDSMDLLFDITFEGAFEDENECPVSVFVRDYKDGRSCYLLDGTNMTGMTVNEFADHDASQLVEDPFLYNRGSIEIPLGGEWLLIAYFTDPEYAFGSAYMLTEAEIIRAG